jgi:hypothetical protein
MEIIFKLRAGRQVLWNMGGPSFSSHSLRCDANYPVARIPMNRSGGIPFFWRGF